MNASASRFIRTNTSTTKSTNEDCAPRAEDQCPSIRQSRPGHPPIHNARSSRGSRTGPIERRLPIAPPFHHRVSMHHGKYSSTPWPAKNCPAGVPNRSWDWASRIQDERARPAARSSSNIWPSERTSQSPELLNNNSYMPPPDTRSGSKRFARPRLFGRCSATCTQF